jgi:hypothetical protein
MPFVPMSQPALLRSNYALLGFDLLQAIETYGEYVEVAAGTALVREGQFVKVVPLVLHGTVKVVNRVMKRPEQEGKIKQADGKTAILYIGDSSHQFEAYKAATFTL